MYQKASGLATALFAILCFLPVARAQDPSLVGLWHFDETSGTTAADASGNGNDGTVSSTGVGFVPGKVGGAFDFSNGSVLVPSDAFDLPAAFTISAWINLDTLGPSSRGRIFDKHSLTKNGYAFYTAPNNALLLEIDYNATPDVRITTLSNVISLGTWVHVAATWGGTPFASGMKIYVNGALVGVQTDSPNGATGRSDDSPNSVRLGNNQPGDRALDGRLDEMRFYNRALSAAEIQDIYSADADSVPSITTTALSSGPVNAAYSQTFAATGGNGALVWSLDSGSLPAGLTLSPAGVISGMPITAGTSGFTVRVADSDANTGPWDEETKALSIDITAVSNVTLDANGWTHVAPNPDSRIVYVSNSTGNDGNDGLTPATAKATIPAGDALIRDGFPDHLLLKRGDTFAATSATILGRWKNGRSANEPIVAASYGTSGPRPVVLLADKFIDHNGQARNFQVIIGLDFYKSTSDPNAPEFDGSDCSVGLRFIGGGADILVEDCRLRFASIAVQSFPVGTNLYTNFRFRRNIVTDNWVNNSYNDGNARIQGLFMSETVGYLIEENVFDHNGWSEVVAGAGANQFNHNVYVQYDNGGGGIMRGNIFARGSAHGLQARSGGVVERNLFVQNAVALNVGGVKSPTQADVATFANRASQNVVLEGRLMDSNGNNELPRTAAVWGIWTAFIDDVRVEDNIVANRIGNGSNRALNPQASTTLVDNIVYEWDPGFNTSDSTWLHPNANLGDYYASIGGAKSTPAYLEWLRHRPVGELPIAMTAYAAINYIRAGFNKGPVAGYYQYDGRNIIPRVILLNFRDTTPKRSRINPGARPQGTAGRESVGRASITISAGWSPLLLPVRRRLPPVLVERTMT